MGPLWIFYSCSLVFLWAPYEFPIMVHWLSYGSPAEGASQCCMKRSSQQVQEWSAQLTECIIEKKDSEDKCKQKLEEAEAAEKGANEKAEFARRKLEHVRAEAEACRKNEVNLRRELEKSRVYFEKKQAETLSEKSSWEKQLSEVCERMHFEANSFQDLTKKSSQDVQELRAQLTECAVDVYKFSKKKLGRSSQLLLLLLLWLLFWLLF